jgi:nitric oxide reductase large subunit
LLIIHPIIQFSAFMLALYAFSLGVRRFRSIHLKQKTVFKWKRHAVAGQIALGTWLAGMLGGMTMVYLYWHGFLITGTHAKVALFMAPLIIFGLFSGLYMDRNKKQRKVLPILHGLNNFILLMFALTQIVTGWGVYHTFVLGN